MLVKYTYHMAKRTTILLDEDTRDAAQQLAVHYDCSISEAIRRAVVRHRDAALGLPANARHERLRILDELFDLFTGHDAAEEVERLKREDEGF